MANALYAKGKEKILSGAINLPSDTIKASLLSSSYTANLSTDEFWSTISANLLNTSQTLGSKSVTAGVFDAADVTFTAVTSGSTVKAVVIWKDTGTASTSPLLVYIDTITGFPLATNGGDITITWDNGSYKIFSL
ncbi:MAG: hypothetical protein RJA36_409 [Pseudomonadota bacterium]|jgi:hypothetical protein